MQGTPRIAFFSYKLGIPLDPAIDKTSVAIIDCRVLPNPWSERALRDVQGTDTRILHWLMFRDQAGVERLLAQAEEARLAGKTYIWFGCYHGRHRSVALAAEYRRRLADKTQAGEGK